MTYEESLELYIKNNNSRHKGGKLPRFKDGRTVIGSNVQMNNDGTFTDDYTRVFDDVVITQNGPRVRPGLLYKYQEPWDDEKFVNAITLGGLNNLSPAQWARRGYDLVTGNLTTDSWLNGNAGIVPNKFAQEHPNAALAANGLFDFWALGGPSLIKNAMSVGKINPPQFTKYQLTTDTDPIIASNQKLQPAQQSVYQIEDTPGYQLKTLMRGNPLEKQLSKTGTISTNSVRAQVNKASEVEKSIINDVLDSQQFAGQKTIDYNDLRRAVHSKLITYNIVPDSRYNSYGMDRLGFKKVTEPDGAGGLVEYTPGVATNTFTFESPEIPIGNAKHYNYSTLGHSRTYTTSEDPDILHVMESQSDWGQSPFNAYVARNYLTPEEAASHHINTMRRLFGRKYPKDVDRYVSLYSDGGHDAAAHGSYSKDFVKAVLDKSNVLENTQNPAAVVRLTKRKYLSKRNHMKYLHDNYQQRLIQENLKYAAERVKTKMRYPTPETAAKIENYTKDYQGYRPEHKTILKKYSDFPKQFKKLHKNADVREVTDNKGNTWYEVDVPKNYLEKEWMYGIGAATVAGSATIKPKK